jgi:hypothetical protein
MLRTMLKAKMMVKMMTSYKYNVGDGDGEDDHDDGDSYFERNDDGDLYLEDRLVPRNPLMAISVTLNI